MHCMRWANDVFVAPDLEDGSGSSGMSVARLTLESIHSWAQPGVIYQDKGIPTNSSLNSAYLRLMNFPTLCPSTYLLRSPLKSF